MAISQGTPLNSQPINGVKLPLIGNSKHQSQPFVIWRHTSLIYQLTRQKAMLDILHSSHNTNQKTVQSNQHADSCQQPALDNPVSFTSDLLNSGHYMPSACQRVLCQPTLVLITKAGFYSEYTHTDTHKGRDATDEQTNPRLLDNHRRK